MPWSFVGPIIPRLLLILFTYSQPLLLQRIVLYLQESHASEAEGYGLIGAYAIVYLGIAVSLVSLISNRHITVPKNNLTDFERSSLQASTGIELTASQRCYEASWYLRSTIGRSQ